MNIGRAISEWWQKGFTSVKLGMFFDMFRAIANNSCYFDGGCACTSSLQVVGRVEDLDKHEVPESFKRCTLQWKECWIICLPDTVYGCILKTYLGQVHGCWRVMVGQYGMFEHNCVARTNLSGFNNKPVLLTRSATVPCKNWRNFAFHR